MTDAVPPKKNEWDADVWLSMDAARALIDAQFPELAPARLTTLGVGWDNWAYRVNDAFVFRFPRRTIARQFIDAEIGVLPLLAGRLPLPTPVPRFVGSPTEAYPFPFVGYPLLAGRTACGASLTDAQRCSNAAALGAFLRTLHRTPIEGALDRHLPEDVILRADLGLRVPRLKTRTQRIVDRTGELNGDRLLREFASLAETPAWTGTPLLCHGDLYARHLLVDDDGRLSGVIDWGDAHRGDPAIDLSIALSFLPADARQTFQDAYGAIDADTWQRARYRALYYGVMLLDYGLTESDAGMATAGRDALRLAL